MGILDYMGEVEQCCMCGNLLITEKIRTRDGNYVCCKQCEEDWYNYLDDIRKEENSCR